ncbi:hypothetical protein PSEUDO8AS_50140 [Pseudomonas sp. 8AS]|nr:hypothetical protein PSEUDO8AS_50140 [Pseudomonas sp. 8AS]
MDLASPVASITAPNRMIFKVRSLRYRQDKEAYRVSFFAMWITSLLSRLTSQCARHSKTQIRNRIPLCGFCQSRKKRTGTKDDYFVVRGRYKAYSRVSLEPIRASGVAGCCKNGYREWMHEPDSSIQLFTQLFCDP